MCNEMLKKCNEMKYLGKEDKELQAPNTQRGVKWIGYCG